MNSTFGLIRVCIAHTCTHLFQSNSIMIQYSSDLVQHGLPAKNFHQQLLARRLPLAKTFAARMDDAASYNTLVSIVSDVSEIIKIGASAGFTLRYVGLFGRFDGSCPRAALIAACTSRAAPLMSRLKSNCKAILVNQANWLTSFPSRLRCVQTDVPAEWQQQKPSFQDSLLAIPLKLNRRKINLWKRMKLAAEKIKLRQVQSRW